MTQYLTGKSLLAILVVVLVRYLFLATVAFLIYYVIKKESWRFRKIQPKFPGIKDYSREIVYSVGTAVIFAVIGYLVYLTPFVTLTKVYCEVGEFGIWYLIASIVFMIVIHDTYFYWTHWLMHKKSIYKWVHRVHHLSTNPSPWAAMAFHPLEAVIEAGIIVIIPFLFPVHPLAIGLFLLLMMVYNVYGHLGYELYPKGFADSAIGRWINTSVNHNMHHQFINGNFGLYFLFWDRWMGTLHPEYDRNFEKVKRRRHDMMS